MERDYKFVEQDVNRFIHKVLVMQKSRSFSRHLNRLVNSKVKRLNYKVQKPEQKDCSLEC